MIFSHEFYREVSIAMNSYIYWFSNEQKYKNIDDNKLFVASYFNANAEVIKAIAELQRIAEINIRCYLIQMLEYCHTVVRKKKPLCKKNEPRQFIEIF